MNLSYFLGIPCLKGEGGCGRWQGRHGSHSYERSKLTGPFYSLY